MNSLNDTKETSNNFISYAIAIGVCTALYLVLRYCFNFYYDLNDDVLIKDILSGTYLGQQDGHDMQMLYPLSWLLKTLYMLNPNVPWMGAGEIIIMWICCIIILARAQIFFFKHTYGKKKIFSVIMLYICSILFILGTELWEMVMIQYTVVSGMLAATAAFWVLTEEDFQVNESILPVILVVLAFNIRSEMLLLMFPFLAAVGLCKWISEGINWQSCKKYISFLAIIVAGMAVSYGINYIAYSSPEWNEFGRVFNARTQIYDFTGIPDYEEHKAFYDEHNISERDYEALLSYNYVISDGIDRQALEDVADYAQDHQKYERSVPYAVFENVKSIFQWKSPREKEQMMVEGLVFQEEGAKLYVPWNILIVFLYAIAILSAILSKDVRWVYTIPVLIIMRMIAWGYIAYMGRINARIAHPLFFIEAVILLGNLMAAWAEREYTTEKSSRNIARLLWGAMVACTIIAAIYIPTNVKEVRGKALLREEYNKEAYVLYKYTASNPREYFLIDVYSTVNFTERIFAIPEYSKANTQLAGGWMAFSPHDAYKSGFYGKEDYKFITSKRLGDKNACDEIQVDGNTVFYVYRLEDIKESS